MPGDEFRRRSTSGAGVGMVTVIFDDAPWPFAILFVGVDNSEKTDPDLNLKTLFFSLSGSNPRSTTYARMPK